MAEIREGVRKDARRNCDREGPYEPPGEQGLGRARLLFRIGIRLTRQGYSLIATVKHKLGAQRMGPFRIIEPVGRGAALRLELHPTFAGHDVISVMHLEPAPAPGSDPFDRDLPEPGPVEIECDEWVNIEDMGAAEDLVRCYEKGLDAVGSGGTGSVRSGRGGARPDANPGPDANGRTSLFFFGYVVRFALP